MPAQEPFCLNSNPLSHVYPRKLEPVDFSKPQLPPWQNGHNDSPVSTHSFILPNSRVVTAAGDEVGGYYISPREQWWWPSVAHRWGTHILTSRKFTLSNCCPLTPATSGCLGPWSLRPPFLFQEQRERWHLSHQTPWKNQSYLLESDWSPDGLKPDV